MSTKWGTVQIDDLSFSGEVGLRLNSFQKHNFMLTLGFVNKKASFSGGFAGAEWNINIIPLSVGYNYSLLNGEENIFNTLVGVNISYNFIQIDEKSYSDIGGHNPNGFYKMNKISLEPNTFLIYHLNDYLSLITKFGYRFIDDVKIWSQELNLSGIILNFGLQIKLLNAI